MNLGNSIVFTLFEPRTINLMIRLLTKVYRKLTRKMILITVIFEQL